MHSSTNSKDSIARPANSENATIFNVARPLLLSAMESACSPGTRAGREVACLCPPCFIALHRRQDHRSQLCELRLRQPIDSCKAGIENNSPSQTTREVSSDHHRATANMLVVGSDRNRSFFFQDSKSGITRPRTFIANMSDNRYSVINIAFKADSYNSGL